MFGSQCFYPDCRRDRRPLKLTCEIHWTQEDRFRDAIGDQMTGEQDDGISRGLVKALFEGVAVLVLIVLLVGCATSEPRIDASTDQSLRVSMDRVLAPMTDEERIEFGQAMITLSFQEVDDLSDLMSSDPEDLAEGIDKIIDGKTAAEILDEAEAIRNGH